MKYIIILFSFISLFIGELNGQTSSDDIIKYVRSKDFGMTYYSYNSDAIRSISFHEVRTESYKTIHFAIVQFQTSFTDYIYQVDYNTRSKYSMQYLTSAGSAFFEYIHPYRKLLGCAPNFD